MLIAELRRLELAAGLIAEAERHARVDDGLPLERVEIILHGDVDVREDLEVRLPVEQRAGFFAVGGLFLHLAVDLAPFEVEVIFEAVAEDPRIEILRGILRGAGAEAVETEGIFIVAALVVAVFAAGVEFAEDEFPVVFLFLFIPVHGAAAAKILDLERVVEELRHDDRVAVALARLVDGVGEDLKHRVLAALQSVGAEDHRRALAYPVGPFEGRDGFISVSLLFFHSCSLHFVLNMGLNTHYIGMIILFFLCKVKPGPSCRFPSKMGVYLCSIFSALARCNSSRFALSYNMRKFCATGWEEHDKNRI